MKKVLALVLALTMVMGLGLVANAAPVISEDLVGTLNSKTGNNAANDTLADLTQIIPGKEYTFVLSTASDSALDVYNLVNGTTGNNRQPKTHDFKIEWNSGKDLFEKFEVVKGVDEMKLVIKAKDNFSTAKKQILC